MRTGRDSLFDAAPAPLSLRLERSDTLGSSPVFAMVRRVDAAILAACAAFWLFRWVGSSAKKDEATNDAESSAEQAQDAVQVEEHASLLEDLSAEVAALRRENVEMRNMFGGFEPASRFSRASSEPSVSSDVSSGIGHEHSLSSPRASPQNSNSFGRAGLVGGSKSSQRRNSNSFGRAVDNRKKESEATSGAKGEEVRTLALTGQYSARDLLRMLGD